MEATAKSTNIESLLASLSGRNRIDSIKNSVCNWCGSPAEEFNNKLSQKEYTISGMCQNCQDSAFGEQI